MSRIRRWGIPAFLLVALVLAMRFLPVGEKVERYTQWIERMGPAGYAVFALTYLVGTLLLFPSGLLAIAAGIAFGVWAIVLVFFSAIIVAVIAFWIGRKLGREKFEKHAATKSRLAKLEDAISEGGVKTVILVRLALLVPFNLSNYLFGVTKTPCLPYVIGTAIGILPGTVIHVYLGHIGQRTLSGQQEVRPAEYILVGVGLLATLVLGIHLKRRMSGRSDSKSK